MLRQELEHRSLIHKKILDKRLPDSFDERYEIKN